MPKILGIVNITEDSFSDGGLYLDPDKAIAQGKKLLDEGADILDLGAASSHPDATAVSAEEEIKRLKPVLASLKKAGAKLSVDSFLSTTQRYAIEQGVDYLNDVSGFMDEAFYPELTSSSCQLIVMHSIQSAKSGKAQASRIPAPAAIFDEVCAFFDKRLDALVKAGIAEDRLILDCGWGFFLGNSPEPSIEMLARLSEFKQRYQLPVLASVSRKSFLRALTGKPLEQIQPATLAAELAAVLAGADFIRTHEPAPLCDGLQVYQALKR